MILIFIWCVHNGVFSCDVCADSQVSETLIGYYVLRRFSYTTLLLTNNNSHWSQALPSVLVRCRTWHSEVAVCYTRIFCRIRTTQLLSPELYTSLDFKTSITSVAYRTKAWNLLTDQSLLAYSPLFTSLCLVFKFAYCTVLLLLEF